MPFSEQNYINQTDGRQSWLLSFSSRIVNFIAVFDGNYILMTICTVVFYECVCGSNGDVINFRVLLLS